MQTLRQRPALLVLVAGFLLVSQAAGTGATLEIAVHHVFHGEPLILDSLRYKNADGETLSVSRLSYLLSAFALRQTNGGWVGLPDQYAWMDAARHRAFIRMDGVPAGPFRGLRFQVGLDRDANAADPNQFAAEHPLNPNLNGLHWSWQGGYVFLALEGLFQTGAEPPKGYSYHFARDPNRTCVDVETTLDLTHDTRVELDFDLGVLLDSPRPLSFAGDGASTHSREGDPVASALAKNLPGAFRLRQVTSFTPGVTRILPVKPLYMPGKFTPYRFTVSRAFPVPDLPRDNPLIEERVVLGQKLFHETALSRDRWISCASCHFPSAGFSDPRRFSVGVGSRSGTRHSMPLFNLAWKKEFFWDGRAPSLRAQALRPIQDHSEMDESLENVAGKLAGTTDYPQLFQAAFGSREITGEKIGLAIEQYVLTLTSADSKFDRVLRGTAKLGPREQRGFELFMTEYEPRNGRYGADCFHCHGGPLFTDHQYHNNGLDLHPGDAGRYNVTTNAADFGKFATPSLRNVEITGPYMHDGRFTTLEEVVEHYSGEVRRSPTLDPNLAKHPDGGLRLTPADQLALVAFLKTLTDERFRPVASESSLAQARPGR